MAAGLYGARQENVAHDALAIGGQYVHLPHAAAVLQLPVFSFHGLAQGLNFVAINGAALQHHFETVVVFGVVAARNLYAAVAQCVRCKVQHGRGHHAYVDHLHTCFDQTGYERLYKLWPAQAAVAANRHGVAAQLTGACAKGAAQAAGNICRQGAGYYAANVIGFEDGSGNLHGCCGWNHPVMGKIGRLYACAEQTLGTAQAPKEKAERF